MSWPAHTTLMPPHAGPAPRRASLREDIRRQTLQQLDSRWHRLWGSFGISVILLSFGTGRLWRHGQATLPETIALVLAGIIAGWLHVRLDHQWRRQMAGWQGDWLTPRERLIVALGLGLAVQAPAEAAWWPVPLLMASGYGMWRLSVHARRCWPHWYFRVARQVLRDQTKDPHRGHARQGS